MADPRLSGLVLIVGPDGAGKTTVVEAVVGRAAAAGVPVAHAHHRPGVIAGRSQGAGPVTDPHRDAPRPVAASMLKLLVVFADHLVGGRTRWRPRRREGLLLLERGWPDMLVDPRRYRLPTSLLPLVRLLGRLVPQPDLVLWLTGDPQRLHERKPEIGEAEVGRQIERWRAEVAAVGGRMVEVDTVATRPQDAADALFAALAGQASIWRRVPLTPQRLALSGTGDRRTSMAVYQPQSVRARAGAAVTRLGLPVRGPVVEPPLARLEELWARLGVTPSGVMAMRSSTAGRTVLSVCCRGRMELVVKVGGEDDVRLRHEAAMLAAPLHATSGLRRPEVAWSGEWNGHFVLATRAVKRSSRAPWSVHDVVPVARALAEAGADGDPLTHGDLAPWNIIRTPDGPVLLDWELARWSDEPLHDLAHFVVQEGALLGRHTPDRAVALLCAPGSPGVTLLEELGRDASDARPLLDAYLTQARPTESRAVRFRDDMLRLVAR